MFSSQNQERNFVGSTLHHFGHKICFSYTIIILSLVHEVDTHGIDPLSLFTKKMCPILNFNLPKVFIIESTTQGLRNDSFLLNLKLPTMASPKTLIQPYIRNHSYCIRTLTESCRGYGREGDCYG